MAALLLLQLALPLALIAWLAFRPLPSRLGLAVQALASAAVLIALHLAGLWLMPPWWTPWLLWLLFGAAFVLAVRRPRRGALPQGPFGWAAVVLLGGLGLDVLDGGLGDDIEIQG
ncbi:MAG: hypothetical protein ACK40O_13330 [Allosphingosinicella sp.]